MTVLWLLLGWSLVALGIAVFVGRWIAGSTVTCRLGHWHADHFEATDCDFLAALEHERAGGS